jgi:ABC-type transporter Mla subunit MlaD
MARVHSKRISRPAIVGLIFIGCVALAIAGSYFTVRYGGTGGYYRLGARFMTVSGLAPGAQVFFSGTNVGSVKRIRLQPDNSVEVIMNIRSDTNIPAGSKFAIQTSFTGSPNIAIAPPANPGPPLPHHVLPISEQPVGTPPLNIDQFMAEGKSLGSRAQRVLKAARSRSGTLMASLQQSRTNAGGTFTELKGVMPAAMAQMQSTMAQARANIARAQRALPTRDRSKTAAAAASLKSSSVALNACASTMKRIARDPQVRANLRTVAQNLKATTANMQATVEAFKGVTGNAQTRAELRDASANLHAIMAKLKSIL